MTTRHESLPDNHNEGSGQKPGRQTRSVQVSIRLAKWARTVANHREESIDKVMERHAAPTLIKEFEKVLDEMAAEQKKQKKGG